MGVMIGFVVGYVLGTRAGDKGVVQQAPAMLRDRLQAGSSGESSAALRPSG
jgi:hypothetical protein